MAEKKRDASDFLGKPIGQIVKQLGLLSEFDIQEGLRAQKEKGGALGQIFLQNGQISEDDLNRALALQRGMDFLELDKVEIPPDVIELVDATTAETFQVMPISYDGSTLVVAISKPDNLNVLDDLRFSLPKIGSFKALLATEEAIKRAFQRYYQQRETGMDELLAGVGRDAAGKLRENIDASQLEADVNAGPVVKLLNMILLQAIRDRGSDIHLEPFEHEFKVRYRVDGVLYEMMPPPVHLARAVISRV